MKKLKLAFCAFASAAYVISLSSCSSDPNPFDKTISTQNNTAKIRLSLNVASTRAENDSENASDLSTSAENTLSVVNIYVFDSQSGLEKPFTNISVSATESVELEVTPGVKNIYVVSAKSLDALGASAGEGKSITDFKNTILNSTLAHLTSTTGDEQNTINEIVMIGASDSQQVMVSANSNEIPQSNVFNIKMVRLLSKTQVLYTSANQDSKFGFTIGNPEFRVCQTSNKMRLVHDPANYVHDFSNLDVYSSGYSGFGNLAFKPVVSEFTADGCHYISENIVEKPVAGNTTFVSLCVPVTPAKYYTYDSTSDELSLTQDAGVDGQDFYCVGVVDSANGLEDFAMDPATGHVITFESETEADAYKNALNGGDASTITVSESESALRAPATRASEVTHKEFSTVKFENGRSYYRINIRTDGTDLKVVRNKFYKITVNSISNLGYHDESLLRPINPETKPDNATSAWIEAQLSVQPWEEEKQEVDL